MDNIETILEKFPFTTAINVQWGEMDAARHVNNTVYLRWAETARIQCFQQLSLTTPESARQGIILGWQDCKYIFPVTYPDTVRIGIQVTEIGSDRFMLQCQIYSSRHQRLAAITNHRLVAYNYETLQKVDLSAQWKAQMETLHL